MQDMSSINRGGLHSVSGQLPPPPQAAASTTLSPPPSGSAVVRNEIREGREHRIDMDDRFAYRFGAGTLIALGTLALLLGGTHFDIPVIIGGAVAVATGIAIALRLRATRETSESNPGQENFNTH